MTILRQWRSAVIGIPKEKSGSLDRCGGFLMTA
jgi:hypothetical protein